MNATSSSVGWLHSAQTEAEGGSGIVVSSQPIGGSTASDWPRWTAAICVFIAYYAGSKIGFLLTFQPHPVSVLWPPNSILLAALLIAPVRTWWVPLLAAAPAHWIIQLQAHIPPMMVLSYYVSNCCEALI